MTIRITEDENETGGYAFVDLGGPLRSPLLSFRRQDAEPRHLGADGWQPEVAWLAPLSVTERDGRAVARFGPTVVDRIEELVPIEIVAQNGTTFGIVAWPFIPPAPAGRGILAGLPAAAPNLTQPGADGPATGTTLDVDAEPVPPPEIAPDPPSPPLPGPVRRRVWPVAAPLLVLALAGGGAGYWYRDRLPDFRTHTDAPPPPGPVTQTRPEPEAPRETAAELRQRYTRLIDTRAAAGAFLDLGAAALASRQGSTAFRAFEEADPVANADAAWQLARFYDPGNADAAYREAARPDVARAAYYYALWRNRSPRHTDALRTLCTADAADERLRAICRP